MKHLGNVVFPVALLMTVACSGNLIAQGLASTGVDTGIAELAGALDDSVTAGGPGEFSQKLEQKDRTIADLLARAAAAEAEVAEMREKVEAAEESAEGANKRALEGASKQLGSAQEAADGSRRRVAELERQLKEARTAIAGADTLETELAKARIELEALRGQLATARKAPPPAAATPVVDVPAELSKLQAELDVMKATETERRTAMEGLFTQLAQIKRSKLSLEAELAAVGKQLTAKQDELARVTAAKAAAASECERSEERIRAEKAQTKRVAEKVAGLETRIVELESQLASSRDRHTELLAEIERLNMTDQQRKLAMDELLTKLARMDRKSAESTTALEKVEKSLRAELFDAQADAKKQKAAAERAKADATTALERVAEAERQVSRSGEQVSQAIAERDRAIADADALRTSVSSLQSKVQEVELTDAQRRKAMDDLLSKSARLEKQTQEQLEDLEGAREQLRQQLAAKIGELEKALSQNMSLTARADQAVKSLVEVTAERDALMSAAGKRDGELKRLTGEVKGLEASLTQARDIDAQRKRNMDKVLMEQAELERRYADLEDELETVRKKLAKAEAGGRSAVPEKVIVEVPAKPDKKAEKQLAALREEQAELQRRYADLEDELETVRKKLAKAEAVPEKVIVEAPAKADKQTDKQLAALREERAELSRRVRELQAELAQRGEAPVVPVPAVHADGVGAAAWETQRADLERTIADLKGQLKDVGTRLEQSMGSEKSLKDRADALEAQLGDMDSVRAAARKEIEATFAGQLSDLTASVKELEGERGRMVRELEKLRNRTFDVRESDLFKSLEKANVTLRSTVVELEQRRKAQEDEVADLSGRLEGAERSSEASERRMRALQSDLSEVEAREKEYKQLIEKMMVRVPDLESAVAELEQQVAERERDISEREARIEALETALEERDHRLRRAEQVAEVLEEAKREVLHVNDTEKRDMHYNMALVYAQEGRAAEAEAEYLSALELDPSDPDIHFNLAILYEEQLKRRERAAIHYRRYLKLEPHGDDSDRVRSWLMRLELNK